MIKRKESKLNIIEWKKFASKLINKVIFRSRSKLMHAWDIYIVLLALWNVLIIPANIAFDTNVTLP